MKRRTFIQNTLATGALCSISGLPLLSFSSNNVKQITILHTNDTHSHIDAFPPNDAKNPNKGGVSRRATLIENIRKENPNTLLLDAGDFFQGTPYFNYYGGELELKMMSMLQYDLATLGNHEFDNGLEGLLAQLPHANFNMVQSNYDFKNTILEGKFKRYKIIVKDGVKIGIFGLGIELAGLVDKKNYKETTYHNPIEIAQEITHELKNTHRCDLIICLSHLGYQYKNDPEKISDLVLASKTKNIDLIIGGHTHTFLDKPTVVQNLEGIETIVNQVGCFGINLGRIDFYLDNDKKKIHTGKTIEI